MLSLMESYQACTKDKDLHATLAIITNTDNVQTLKDIEKQLVYKGSYQFGRIFSGWFPDAFFLSTRKLHLTHETNIIFYYIYLL